MVKGISGIVLLLVAGSCFAQKGEDRWRRYDPTETEVDAGPEYRWGEKNQGIRTMLDQ